MSIEWNKNDVSRSAGETLFVPGNPVCGLAFSFYDCAPAPQEPQITVLSDVSDLSDSSDRSDYSFIAEAARDFRGWLTVTACAVIRKAVRTYRKIVCAAKAVFSRRERILTGGLRL